MKLFGIPCLHLLTQPTLRIITQTIKLTSEFESSPRCAGWCLAPTTSEVTAHLGYKLEFLLTLSTSVAEHVLTVSFLPMRVSIFTPRANYLASQHPRTFIKHVDLASNYVILNARIIAPSQKPFYSVFTNCPIFFSCISCRNQCRSLANGRNHSHQLHRCGCQGTPISLTRVHQQLSFAL